MKFGLTAVANVVINEGRQTLQRYPKQFTALLAFVLAGSGATAFAISHISQSSANLSVHQVVEPVQSTALNEQVKVLATPSFHLFRSDVTRSSDSADTLLRRLGVHDPAAAAFLRRDSAARAAFLSASGRPVTAESTVDKRLVGLSTRWIADEQAATYQRIVVSQGPQGLQSKVETLPLTVVPRMASGTVRSTLFDATDAAHIPDAVADQMADLFSGDIDFRQKLRVGDHFAVAYESLQAEGEQMRVGRVLSAEFTNQGKTYRSVWFQAPGEKGAYYTPEGLSLHHAFLASPLQFTHITSGFKMRFDPYLKTWRAHTGVDLAAAIGTPVHTVGDGVVVFAGQQRGYGNMVQIQHNATQSTVYGHLSRILVRKGEKVKQNQEIALSGMTGWATGPHLHFEFRVNGVYKDPTTIAQETNSEPVPAAYRASFKRVAQIAAQELAQADAMQMQAKAD